MTRQENRNHESRSVVFEALDVGQGLRRSLDVRDTGRGWLEGGNRSGRDHAQTANVDGRLRLADEAVRGRGPQPLGQDAGSRRPGGPARFWSRSTSAGSTATCQTASATRSNSAIRWIATGSCLPVRTLIAGRSSAPTYRRCTKSTPSSNSGSPNMLNSSRRPSSPHPVRPSIDWRNRSSPGARAAVILPSTAARTRKPKSPSCAGDWRCKGRSTTMCRC